MTASKTTPWITDFGFGFETDKKMPRTELSPYAKIAAGEEIIFCEDTQSWWPKNGVPAGAITKESAMLDAPACYQKNVGMRTRDIKFSPLVNDGTLTAPATADEADTELDGQANDY